MTRLTLSRVKALDKLRGIVNQQEPPAAHRLQYVKHPASHPHVSLFIAVEVINEKAKGVLLRIGIQVPSGHSISSSSKMCVGRQKMSSRSPTVR